MPKPEAMTAETFSEGDYRDKLLADGYSSETAKMLAAKKKESLAGAKKIEIDLGSLAKSRKKVWVKPTAQKKGYYREQEVGRIDDRAKSLRYSETKLIEAEKRGDNENVKILKDWIKRLKSSEKVDLNEAPSGYGRKVSGNGTKKLSESQKRTLFGKFEEAEEFEHLSPEERKKRQKDRNKRQKERAAHRAIRQKQHDEVEESIPEGK